LKNVNIYGNETKQILLSKLYTGTESNSENAWIWTLESEPQNLPGPYHWIFSYFFPSSNLRTGVCTGTDSNAATSIDGCYIFCVLIVPVYFFRDEKDPAPHFQRNLTDSKIVPLLHYKTKIIPVFQIPVRIFKIVLKPSL
jgi:hypothetical protein